MSLSHSKGYIPPPPAVLRPSSPFLQNRQLPVSILNHSHFAHKMLPPQDSSRQITINNNGPGVAIAENRGTVNNYASKNRYFKQDIHDQLTKILWLGRRSPAQYPQDANTEEHPGDGTNYTSGQDPCRVDSGCRGAYVSYIRAHSSSGCSSGSSLSSL